MASVNTKGLKINPFPGLRPFSEEEDAYFFGRESESSEIVSRLIKNRFVAVTGASGSGKSSLIRCGVIRELKAQSDKGKGKWRIFNVRPGNNPFENLAEAFVENMPDQQQTREEIVRLLKESPLDARALIKKLKLDRNVNVLLVIDQFEELFRYGSPETGKGHNRESGLFIEFLTSAVSASGVSFYSVIALRSDLISECSQFKVFTQLVNNSNFLVPVMTQENFREAITSPITKAGATIDEDLVEVLLEDINYRTDQLPVLQHALMRTWDRWIELEEPDRPLSLSDYTSVGTMKDAISRHADEVFEKLPPEAKKICEKLFKIISGKGADNKGIRYPSNIRTIRLAIPCTAEELKEVIERFRDPSISFLTPDNTVSLDDDIIVDLSHENLIHLWERLKKWVDEETESVKMYLQLSEASALYQNGRAGLLKQPDLQVAVKWRDENRPTLWWAQKYHPAFERAMVYLRTSEKAFLEAEEQKARQHRWRLKRIRLITSILGGTALVTFLALAGVFFSKIHADNLRNEALRQREEIAAQKSLTDQYAAIVVKRSVESDSAASAASRREIEEKELREAIEDKLNLTRLDLETAQQENQEASAAVRTAIDEKAEAERNRMISVAKSMSLRSTQIPEKKDLQSLLAYQAYLFNNKNKGHWNDADIYAGLYSMAKNNGSPHYRTFPGHEGLLQQVAFVPGTREFLTSGSDGKVLRWNLDDKEKNFRIVYSDNEIIEVMAISPGADWLACGGERAGIKMIPLNGGGNPYELSGHAGKIRSLVFSYDGKTLYSAALDGKVLKWDLAARTSTDLASDIMKITSIDISSNGEYLAGMSADGKALVWNPEMKEERFSIGSPGKSIRSLKFKPEETKIAVGYSDGTVELWDIASKQKIAELDAHSGEVNIIRFNSKYSQMATAGNDGLLKVWDNNDLQALPLSFNDNGGVVITLQFSPDGEVILSGTGDTKPQITGRPTHAETFAADGCNYVTRNFTSEEWIAYVGRDVLYEKTCPQADFKIRIREVR